MTTEKLDNAAATAIVGQKVLPGREREFEAWQEDLNAAAAHVHLVRPWKRGLEIR